MCYLPSTLRRSAGFEVDTAYCNSRLIPTEFGLLTIRDRRRLQLGAQHATALGSRAIAHLLVGLARRGDGVQALLDDLDVCRVGLSVEQLRAVGGDLWPAASALKVAS